MVKTGLVAAVDAYLGGPRLIGWQFAANGKWEAAERVSFSRNLGEDIAHIRNWLARQEAGNIAFEALLETSHEEPLFFGVRITRLPPAKKAALVETVMSRAVKNQALPLTVDQIRAALGQPKLATEKPDYLDLGVYNLWNRVKPVVVWEKEQTVIAAEDIGKYSQTPDAGYAALHEPQPSPLMLCAAWHQGSGAPDNFQCWISAPVDRRNKTGKYVLDADRYRKAVELFIS